MKLTEEELQKILKDNLDLKVAGEGPGESGWTKEPTPPGIPPTTKVSKYRSRRTEYNGKKYDSKKEADKAKELDMQVKAGELSFYLAQVTFRLPGGTVHRVDFVEFEQMTGTGLYHVRFVEVKGYDNKLGRLKRKQTEEIYHIQVEVV